MKDERIILIKMKILGINIATKKAVELASDKKQEKEQQKQSRRKLSNKILLQRRVNVDVEMEEFIQAVELAKDIERPDRKPLYSIYEKIIERDAHLRSQLRTAHFTVQQSMFQILKNDTENTELKKLFEKSWFTDFMTYATDQEFWGHSLVEFGQMIDNEFKDVTLIDRFHVIPEYQKVILETTDDIDDGISYGKNLNSWFLVEIGGKRDLGLLLTACIEIIYKKNSRGDWSAFNERFGMPLLSITTDTSNETELDELENMAVNFGSNGYVIGSKETEFDIKQGSSTEDGHKKYREFAEDCDNYISKLINGQSATSDEKAFVGSAEVQERVLNTYIKGRLQRIQRVINDKLIPFLTEKGYPLQDVKFQFTDLLKKEIKETVTDKGTEKKKSEFHLDLNSFYNTLQSDNNVLEFALPGNNLKSIFDKLVKRLHNLASKDKLPDDSELIKEGEELIKETALVFEKAVGKGIELAKYTPDQVFKQKLTQSVWVFSGFKADRQLKDITKLLRNGDKLKPFNIFRDEVLKIHRDYNVNWLQTEYNQAVSATQTAVKWNKFEKNKDRYYLQYRTAGDERVRTSHANLNRITLPLDDDFWNEHYPPNGWGCRCTSVQVLKSQYDETSQEDVKVKTKNIFPTEKDKIFAYNPGKTIAPFPPKHPYYIVKYVKTGKTQNSLIPVIKNEALNLWARTHARRIAKKTIENNKNIIGKSFTLKNIKDPVFITKNTFKKNLRYGDGFIKRVNILENLETIIPKLKYDDSKKVIEKDYTIEQWKTKQKVKAYHFFKGKFEGTKFQIDIEERTDNINIFYNIKLLK